MNTSFKRYSIAAELLTSVVYQPYMPTEIQQRYNTPIFAPFCSLLHGTHTPSFSTVSLFMDNERVVLFIKMHSWDYNQSKSSKIFS